jgi:hypothetical protein
VRLEAKGPLIAGTDFYKIMIDACVTVTKPGNWNDQTGVAAQEYDLVPTLDPTSNLFTRVTVVNTRPQLSGRKFGPASMRVDHA